LIGHPVAIEYLYFLILSARISNVKQSENHLMFHVLKGDDSVHLSRARIYFSSELPDSGGGGNFTNRKEQALVYFGKIHIHGKRRNHGVLEIYYETGEC